MTQQDTPTKNMFVFFSVEKLSYDCNHKICKTLQPDLTLDLVHGVRRVTRETRATKAYVALEVFSDRSAESVSSINLLTRS